MGGSAGSANWFEFIFEINLQWKNLPGAPFRCTSRQLMEETHLGLVPVYLQLDDCWRDIYSILFRHLTNLHVQGGRNYQLEVGAHNSTPKGYNASFIRPFLGVITPCSMSSGVFCSGFAHPGFRSIFRTCCCRFRRWKKMNQRKAPKNWKVMRPLTNAPRSRKAMVESCVCWAMKKGLLVGWVI